MTESKGFGAGRVDPNFCFTERKKQSRKELALRIEEIAQRAEAEDASKAACVDVLHDFRRTFSRHMRVRAVRVG